MMPPYAPPTVAGDTMLYWLARAAKDAREAAGRKQVHVGAEVNRDQSAIYRFEQANAWPRNPDLILAGYAQDLDISPLDLWQRALDMWRDSGEVATVAEISARHSRTLATAHEDAERAEQRSGRAGTRSAKGSRSATR